MKLARQPVCRASFCVAALMSFDAAHAVSNVTYVGDAAAKDWAIVNPQEQVFSATTATPASYMAIAGSNQAVSTSDAANGGSVFASASSLVVPTSFGFDVSGQAGATTTLSYRARLIGPDTPFVVPVRVVANGAIHSTGSAYGLLSFVVNYDAGGSFAQLLGSQSVYNTNSSVFSFDQVANFKANEYFDVYLSVTASAGFVGAATAGSSQAFLDPVFTVADVASAALYRFEGVPGIAPSVPEPEHWVLMLIGLAAIGCARRVR